MWNYVLSPCEMEDYMKDQHSTPGNLIDWNGLDYNVVGTVMIDDEQICRDLKPKGTPDEPPDFRPNRLYKLIRPR
ncbi:hypothetical protein EYF80_017331 [Liparis tanakae]|uniref:Pentraxin (PTX) domain-containing protein n=1 Tax=Liparis tanakae TaxID=230148 RepID=A0A4Z2I4M5_9TELE|nr:hypothetical protein EYF80_017331 [Liparis tanakae]